jgi:2,4-dienoyl-CoA reductase-like NADH-dependent reductase (Old Yellow Enzyme family)
MSHLFSPWTLRDLTLRNRIVMAPMCMHSAATDGRATDWHLAHYVARACGGTGLLLTEATAVESRGRISANDLGLWTDAQIAPLARVVQAVQAEGAAIGVQLAHAGRKAWSADKGHGPHQPVAPSPLPFAEGWQAPAQLTADEIEQIIDAWQAAATRALDAGFDAIEIHSAHGYLSHEFLSPLSNQRRDAYGGSPANRMRFLLRVVEAVRAVWPAGKPLFVRVSATDWAAGGLTVDDIVAVARELPVRGVDMVHCSSGGAVPAAPPNLGPGYQIPFAAKVRREAEVPTIAVGLITRAELADEVIRNGRADLVALGRELLRHPHWPLDAARTLGHEIEWPRQYRRARLD